jgi:hypothetical protein
MSGQRYKFTHPDAIASNGGDLFVANEGNSVTEISATSGDFVRVISGSEFEGPTAIAAAGGNLFVTNFGGGIANQDGSVAELSTKTGALMGVISASNYRFDGPDAIAIYDGELFVADYSDDSLTCLSAS